MNVLLDVKLKPPDNDENEENEEVLKKVKEKPIQIRIKKYLHLYVKYSDFFKKVTLVCNSENFKENFIVKTKNTIIYRSG